MKKIIIDNLTLCMFGPNNISFSLLEKIDGTYKQIIDFHSCRSWMCDNLFNIKNKKYKIKTTSYPFWHPFNHNKGNIYVAVSFTTTKEKKVFLQNIKILHAKEKQAGVKRCVVYETQNAEILVVKGSKYWKDSCWKMMLYTFYIKTLHRTNPKEVDAFYWDYLTTEKEDKLLANVKMAASKEIFDDSVYPNQEYGRHSNEGFVAICSGNNPPMAKLLGV